MTTRQHPVEGGGSLVALAVSSGCGPTSPRGPTGADGKLSSQVSQQALTGSPLGPRWVPGGLEELGDVGKKVIPLLTPTPPSLGGWRSSCTDWEKRSHKRD